MPVLAREFGDVVASGQTGQHRDVHDPAEFAPTTATVFPEPGGATRTPATTSAPAPARSRKQIARAVLPELLAFLANTGFLAENANTLVADWDDAPRAYRSKTTKLVLQRSPSHRIG